MIEGVVVRNLKQFKDDRGKVMHMLKSTDDIFEKFGDIYFAVVNPGFIKAWKMHKQKTSYYCVIKGNAKIVLYDLRHESPTKNETQEINAGEENYVIVKIPPGIAHGFTCAGDEPAFLANLATHPYDPTDNFDIDYKSGQIDYKW